MLDVISTDVADIIIIFFMRVNCHLSLKMNTAGFVEETVNHVGGKKQITLFSCSYS